MNYVFSHGIVLSTGDYKLESFFTKLQRAFYGTRRYYIDEFRKELEDRGIVDLALIEKAKECVFFYNRIKNKQDLHCEVRICLLERDWIGVLIDELRNVFIEHYTDGNVGTEEKLEYFKNLAMIHNDLTNHFVAADNSDDSFCDSKVDEEELLESVDRAIGPF